jgi:hypothetical protein
MKKKCISEHTANWFVLDVFGVSLLKDQKSVLVEGMIGGYTLASTKINAHKRESTSSPL